MGRSQASNININRSEIRYEGINWTPLVQIQSNAGCCERDNEPSSSSESAQMFLRKSCTEMLRDLIVLVRFQVLMAASVSKIIVDRRFRGTCCLHYQGA
jgi:hypothetical protein